MQPNPAHPVRKPHTVRYAYRLGGLIIVCQRFADHPRSSPMATLLHAKRELLEAARIILPAVFYRKSIAASQQHLRFLARHPAYSARQIRSQSHAQFRNFIFIPIGLIPEVK
jgi:hypothetical protein